ncbi:MAG: PorV/PorQ family protein [bacterium]
MKNITHQKTLDFYTTCIWVLLIQLFLLFSAPHLAAKEDGGQAGAYLSWGTGVRALGMGRTYTGLADDASAPYWNPAGLGQIRSMEIGSLYSFLWEDTSYSYLSVVYPLHFNQRTRPHVIGISAVNLTSTNFKKTDQFNNDIGNASDMETTVMVSYGKEVYPFFYTGANIKIAQQIIDGYSNTGMGADCGILYKPIIGLTYIDDKLSLGMSVLNIIKPKIKLKEKADTFPLEIKTGIAYEILQKKLTAVIDINKNEKRSLKMHYGLEYSALDLLSFRAGMNENELTGGLGIRFKDISLNYAYAYHNMLEKDLSLGSSHRFGLNIKFPRDFAKISCIPKEQFLTCAKDYEKHIKEDQKQIRIIERMKEAVKAFEDGRSEKSFAIFEQIYQLSENNVFAAESLAGMADAALYTENIKQAERYVSKLEKLCPEAGNDERIRVLRAKIYLARGDTDNALSVIDGLESDDALWIRIKIYEKCGKLALALAEIRDHSERFPHSPRQIKRRVVLAEILYESGEYTEANEEFESFIADYPEHENNMYCRYLIASAQILQGQYEKAYKGFTYVAEHAGNADLSFKAAYMKAESAYFCGKPDEAILLFEAVARDAKDIELSNDAHYRVCLIYYALNDIDKLDKKCGKLAGKDKHARFITLQGLVTFLKGDKEKAQIYYNEALEKVSDAGNINRNIVLMSLSGSPARVRSLVQKKTQEASWERYISLYMAADQFFREGHYHDAEELFLEIATQSEEPRLRVSAEIRHADCLSQDGRYERALQNLRRIENDTNYPCPKEIMQNLWMGLGHLSYKMKKYNEAERYYSLIIEAFPDSKGSVQAYFYKGETLAYKGQYTNAITEWINMAHIFPEMELSREALANAGSIAFAANIYEDVIRVSKTVSSIYPDSELDYICKMQSAKASYNQRMYSDAILMYQNLLAETTIQAKIDRIENELSIAYYQIGLNEENGEQLLDEFSKQYPNRRLIGEVYWQIGAKYYDSNNYAEAEKRFHKVITEYPHCTSAYQALFYLAESMYWQMKLEVSVLYYRRLIDSYPSDVLAGAARFRMANAYFRLGRIPASIVLYKYILSNGISEEVKKNSMMNLAVGYCRINDIANAINASKEFIRLYADSDEGNTIKYQLARIYQDEGTFERAVEMFNRVKPVKKISKAEIIYRIGISYLKMGKEEEAIKTFRSLMKLKTGQDPYFIKGLVELAVLMEDKKNVKQALSIYTILRKYIDNNDAHKLIDLKIKELEIQLKDTLTWKQ